MKETDLRIGNLVNYETLEGDVLTNIIDWQDLKWLSEDEQSFNLAHSPIPLTEEWLLKFGFVKNNNNQFILMEGGVDILFNKDLNGWTCDGINFSINMTEHVHQLQNLYFALTGTELIQK
jgi:hypothetical protein